MPSKPNQAGRRPGSVRIIGGEWRGRRLPVPDIPGLRPSGDRCRETLFNWLQPELHRSTCLDLFAGTGVLGLEAASRGAAGVMLVEKSRPAAAALRSSVELLRAEQVVVVEADALDWLAAQGPEISFDIVFVDPPFGSGLAASALEHLGHGNRLHPGGHVYLESARSEAPVIDSSWNVVREKFMGEVRMQILAKRPGIATPSAN